MTIIGTARLMKEEDDPEEYRNTMYEHDLDMFEGVEGYHYGIIDDLDNLKKLIDLIGKSVIEEENDFREIKRQEFDPETLVPSEKLMAAWHKKLYRPFSYKAMFMLIQSIFENGIADLRFLMLDAKRLKVSKRDNGLLRTLKEFKNNGAPITTEERLVKIFSFIRNKITHSDGYFKREGEKIEFRELMRFVETRADIFVTELKNLKANTHTVSK